MYETLTITYNPKKKESEREDEKEPVVRGKKKSQGIVSQIATKNQQATIQDLDIRSP